MPRVSHVQTVHECRACERGFTSLSAYTQHRRTCKHLKARRGQPASEPEPQAEDAGFDLEARNSTPLEEPRSTAGGLGLAGASADSELPVSGVQDVEGPWDFLDLEWEVFLQSQLEASPTRRPEADSSDGVSAPALATWDLLPDADHDAEGVVREGEFFRLYDKVLSGG